MSSRSLAHPIPILHFWGWHIRFRSARIRRESSDRGPLGMPTNCGRHCTTLCWTLRTLLWYFLSPIVAESQTGWQTGLCAAASPSSSFSGETPGIGLGRLLCAPLSPSFSFSGETPGIGLGRSLGADSSELDSAGSAADHQCAYTQNWER